MTDERNTHAADVVGVFDSKFAQLFPRARPIKATVKESAKVMEHPVESGATITDHRVILPTEIELTVIVIGEDYRDTYERIRAVFRQTETIIVQTRTGSYENMIVEAMPHDETPEMHEAVPIAIKLREVTLVTAQFQALPPKAVGTGKGARNASTVKKGEQSGKPEGTAGAGGKKKSSILYGIIYGGGG